MRLRKLLIFSIVGFVVMNLLNSNYSDNKTFASSICKADYIVENETQFVSFTANKSFYELEKTINKNLDIINQRYVYTKKQELNILNAISDFDLNRFNQETGQSYTKESFKEMIMSRIKNADLSVKEINLNNNSRYCNRVYTESGWNYTRYWTNQSGTIQWADQLNDTALLDTGLGIGAGFFGPGGMACSVLFTVHGVYCSSLAAELLKKETGCGVRTDINSFYAAYTVIDQKNL